MSGVVTNDESVESTIIVQCNVYNVLWQTMPSKPSYNLFWWFRLWKRNNKVSTNGTTCLAVQRDTFLGSRNNQRFAYLGFHHDYVTKLKHFSRYWPLVRGCHRSLVNSLHKASDAELWCFLWSVSEQMVKYIIMSLEIWVAIARIMTLL